MPVTIEPGGATVWVPAGTAARAAMLKAGVAIPAPCGGRGICGGCGVRVLAGRLDEPDPDETRALRFGPPNVRLSCRARIVQAVTLRPVVASSPTLVEHTRGSGDIERRRVVAAVDLGTTSVAAVVIDSESGREIGRSSVANHQAAWGSDVISRIQAAVEGDAEDLAAAADASVLAALGEACDQAGSCVSAVERLVVAGNTAMSSLILRADVSSLAAHPFTPPYRGAATLPAESAVVGAISADAKTVVMPALGGFIGGDITAGLVATGYSAPDGTRMLIDLGTNAEIVCAVGDDLVGASAAAGPAFEGFGILCGGPAAPGAVERVEFTDGTLRLDVVGRATPGWLCGSGLVSAIALLRRLGHLAADGSMASEGPLEDRFVRVDGVLAVVLAEETEAGAAAKAGSHPGVLLTQQDVRTFQLAKGAVLTATAFVLERVGSAAALLGEVEVAGAFGAALSADDLLDLGVVPKRLEGLLRVAGNTSLDGAVMIALDEGLERVAESLPSRFTHVDLASEPSFGSAFIGALSLEPQDGR